MLSSVRKPKLICARLDYGIILSVLVLGDDLLDEVKRALELLSEYPEERPIYYNGFRRLITNRFPYNLFYRLENDRVVVFRILHAKRDHRRFLQ